MWKHANTVFLDITMLFFDVPYSVMVYMNTGIKFYHGIAIWYMNHSNVTGSFCMTLTKKIKNKSNTQLTKGLTSLKFPQCLTHHLPLCSGLMYYSCSLGPDALYGRRCEEVGSVLQYHPCTHSEGCQWNAKQTWFLNNWAFWTALAHPISMCAFWTQSVQPQKWFPQVTHALSAAWCYFNSPCHSL